MRHVRLDPAWGFLIAALLIVAAVRLVPFGTSIAADWADLAIRQRVAAQIAERAQTSIDLLDAAATERDVDAWIAANPEAVHEARERLARDYRESIGFTGADGRSHLYVAEPDSYYWLRLARLRLQNGVACDRVEGARCVDALADAPMGMEIRYARSPHVAAIAATHRLLSWLDPGVPLERSARVLCFLLSLLAVVPAFLLGRRLSNALGGLVAAVLICANTVVLQRTAGADNDVWTIALPLFVAWLLALAFEAPRWPSRVLWAGLAGGALGVLAAAWAGWWLFYLIALGGLVAANLLRLVRSKGARGTVVIACGTLLLAVTIGALIVAAGFGVTLDLSDPAGEILRTLGLSDGRALDTAPWPNTFAFINELAVADLATFARVFGPVALIVGSIGLIPAMRHRRAGPLAAFCAVWLAATAILAAEAARYLVLIVLPLGLATGAGVGWVTERALAHSCVRFGSITRRAVIAALVIAVVGPALYQGYRAGRQQSPGLTDAWTDTFRTLQQASGPDAILNIWWDYGHWAKYLAERRTTSDGASLRTRTQHWMARALAVPQPAESVKLLRMVDCGAAIDPDDGARLRPFEMLLKWGADEASAYGTILELTRAANDGREGYLDGLGLAPARRAALLRTIDCAPPESYLVLASEMTANLNWLAAGFWNPFRASVVEFARRLPADQAIARIEKDFALAPEVARQLYDEAHRVRTEEQRKAFAAVDARLFVTKWQPCFPDGATLRCPLAVIDGEGRRWREVRFDAADPAGTVLTVEGAPDGRLVPALIQVALPDRLVGFTPATTPTANLALLIDPVGRRLFVGTPGVVQSLLTRLVLLDGRYDAAFEKVQDRPAIDGNRITTWRIRWDRQ